MRPHSVHLQPPAGSCPPSPLPWAALVAKRQAGAVPTCKCPFTTTLGLLLQVRDVSSLQSRRCQCPTQRPGPDPAVRASQLGGRRPTLSPEVSCSNPPCCGSCHSCLDLHLSHPDPLHSMLVSFSATAHVPPIAVPGPPRQACPGLPSAQSLSLGVCQPARPGGVVSMALCIRATPCPMNQRELPLSRALSVLAFQRHRAQTPPYSRSLEGQPHRGSQGSNPTLTTC